MPYLKALIVGGVIGVLYVVVRVKSPAPPPVALIGLLGMLLGPTVLDAL
ncbi:DUF1427 family protein [Streptomyces sp. NPDC003470]